MEMQTIVREYDSKTAEKSTPDNICYTLYFKGLIRESDETTGLSARYGVAICIQEDNNLLFQMKGSLHDISAITVLEAKLTALKRGLTEGVRLGISHILIYCDTLQIYNLFMGRSAHEPHNIALLMDDVQRIRQQFTSSILVLGDQVKFAYELAKETLISEISISMPLEKKTCRICFDNGFEAEQMFSVGLCGHEFCLECMKQHIRVGLLEGSAMTCPNYRCDMKLTLASCANLLTPKHRDMWERRVEEESIPVADRIYCPNPTCSALISATKISKSNEEDGPMRCWFKCGKPFCISCKVPWHSDLSCDDYRTLGPNPTDNDVKLKLLANKRRWRQCEKCNLMIERSEGCIKMMCMCGYSFCYTCGAEWKRGGCPHEQDLWANAVYVLILGFVIVGLIIFPIFYTR